MNIEGVPETVPLSKVKAFLTDLGFDLYHMPKDEGGVVIAGANCIRATVFAHNEKGLHYLDQSTGKAAMHEVYIRVVDDTREIQP